MFRWFLAVFNLGIIVPGVSLSEPWLGAWDGRMYSATGNHVYSNISSDTYSEIMSIDAFVDDFSGPLESGSIAFTYNIAEFGVQYDGWRIARMFRYDYSLKFSLDTAQLNFQIERGGSDSIDQNAAYEIYLDASHVRSRGFTLGKTLQIKHKIIEHWNIPMTMDVSVSWMESSQYYDGFIHMQLDQGDFSETLIDEFEADLQALANRSFDTPSDLVQAGQLGQVEVDELRAVLEQTNLQADVDYSYYRPALREDDLDGYEALNPKGSGFSINLQLFAEITDRWTVNLDIRDIYSRIKWKNTGTTRATLRATQAGLAALDLVDEYLQEDVINRFSGSDFSPINPNDPDDPGAVIPERRQQIEDEYLPYEVSKGRHTQKFPVRMTLHNNIRLNDWLSGTITYKQWPVIDLFSFGAIFYDYFSLGFEPKTNSKWVGFSHPYFSLVLHSDSSQVDEAKRLNLVSSIRVPW